MKIKGKVYAILVIMLCMAIVLPYKINSRNHQKRPIGNPGPHSGSGGGKKVGK